VAPNIVVLLLDAARADHLSAYGYERTTTPFIDQLAAEGVRHDPVYANSVFSLPSYASLFTGEYPTIHGAVDWSQSVGGNPLVEGLSDRGYDTAAVSTHLVTGEFGLAGAFDTLETVALTPDDRLFDDDPVGRRLAEYGTEEGWESERQKYAVFLQTLLRHPSPKSLLNGGYAFYRKLLKRAGFWGDDGGRAVVDRVDDVIDELGDPFFLFANFVETHDPYRPPRSVRSQFLPEDATLDEVRDAVEYSSVRASLGFEEMDDRRRRILRGLYDAELAYVDGLVADVHDCLERRGVADETVFVVLSDHGDFFGEHGLWGHQGGVYDPVSRVPLVVRYPWAVDDQPPGPYELRGLPGHLHAVADGSRTPMEAPGEALVEYYGLDTQLSFTPWKEYDGVSAEDWGQYQCSYTDGTHQLICRADGAVSLYAHDDVVGESDRAAAEPAVVDRLYDRVVELVGEPSDNHARYRQTADSDDGLGVDGDVRDRLEQLGYTE
jgi:arylsulfatase A-like enzyme